MLYSIIANFVMVARQDVYCEFCHGCKSGSYVSRQIESRQFMSHLNSRRFASRQNIDTLCPDGSLAIVLQIVSPGSLVWP
jgi:hypothetical protein